LGSPRRCSARSTAEGELAHRWHLDDAAKAAPHKAEVYRAGICEVGQRVVSGPCSKVLR